jgi:hypothetical protein
MDRRLVGVAVLVLAIVAVAVVPNLQGRRVAGTSVAVVFAAPPQVGDCALPPLPEAEDGAWIQQVRVTDLRFGPCSGDIAGEVVGLRDFDPNWPDADTFRGRGPCFRETAGYAGLSVNRRSSTLPEVPFDGVVSWTPTIGTRALLIMPGTRERNAGATWAGCLAVPTEGGKYQGSLRAAHTSGRMPDVFGLCWDSVDLDESMNLLACNEPHPAELLATGWVRNRQLVTSDKIAASCTDIAGRIMHTSDPTRGGALAIILDPVSRDGAAVPNAPLSVSCFVSSAGPTQLVGTLIGIGERPIPFAS